MWSNSCFYIYFDVLQLVILLNNSNKIIHTNKPIFKLPFSASLDRFVRTIKREFNYFEGLF
jgi:hypothetical protein